MDPDPNFSETDPDFVPIRNGLRKKAQSGSGSRPKDPDPKHWQRVKMF